jgi:hypothetical protein
LSFLLLVQIFWFIGTTWRSDLESHRAELDRIAGSLREMMLEVKAKHDAETYLRDIKGRHSGGKPNQTPDFFINGNKDVRTSIDEWLRELRKKQDQTALLFANATLRGDRVEKMLQGNYKMLNVWDFVTDLVERFSSWKADRILDKGKGTSEASNTEVGSANYLSGKLAPSSVATANVAATTPSCFDDPVNDFYRMLCNKANELEEEQLGIEDALVNSKSTLAVVSQYLLPLLYGLMGSLAYILRTLSSEIQNVTFTRGSEIRYALRWPLGMLGGVTVGLFFEPADFSGLAAITPLGLAFLAGYGVELLFAALDRLVSTFTGDGTGPAKAARAE